MTILDLLKVAIERDASDLHLKAGNFPIIRVGGKLEPLMNYPRLSPGVTKAFADQITSDVQNKVLSEALDFDLAYGVKDLGRFRVNIFQQRGSTAIAIRIIPMDVLTIEELHLPKVIEKLALSQRGLILVTGTSGSGKSTTLASIINHINHNVHCHIISIEDPIEYLHLDRKSLISQREVGLDVQGFSTGLRAALREDPDVIHVGEMRDRTTIETALIAAETGHLVLSTVHTLDAPEAINRIVSTVPPQYQKQTRLQLASIFKAIISMRLIPRKDGKGRVPAVEVMISTPFITDCIKDEQKVSDIHSAIEKGHDEYEMQTFDLSIFQLYSQGLITFDQGINYSSSPDEFKMRARGVTTSQEFTLRDEVNKKGPERR